MKNLFAIVGVIVVAKKGYEFVLEYMAMKEELERRASCATFSSFSMATGSWLLSTSRITRARILLTSATLPPFFWILPVVAVYKVPICDSSLTCSRLASQCSTPRSKGLAATAAMDSSVASLSVSPICSRSRPTTLSRLTFRLDRNVRPGNVDQLPELFRRASYLCKAATKRYGYGFHGFGCSRG